MKNSCWVHCWRCRGSGGAGNNKEPLAAAAAAAVAAVALGSAGCRAIGAEEGLAGLGVVARGSVPVPGSVRGLTDEESRGGVDAGGPRRV